MSNPPAGWYPDPELVNTRRYWDGEHWTGHRQEVPVAQVSLADAGYSEEPQPERTSLLGQIGRALAIVAVAGVVLLVVKVWNAPPSEESKQRDAEFGAQDVCQTFVERRLKSPGTADFSELSATGSEPDFVVTGSVDSENSFGGTVRNTFECTVTHTDGDNYRLVDLALTEN